MALSVPKRNKKCCEGGEGEEGGGGEEKFHLLTHATARGMGKNGLKLGIAWKVGQGGGFGLAQIVWCTFLLRGEID